MWSWSWSFTNYSVDSLPVIRDRLAAELTWSRPRFMSEEIKFRGEIRFDKFWIIRNHFVMERWWPIVAAGQLISTEGGTAIKVTMRPTWGSVVFACAFSIIFLVLPLWPRLVSDSDVGGTLWCLIPFLLFGVCFQWCIAFLGWAGEKNVYQDGLTQILAPPARSPLLAPTSETDERNKMARSSSGERVFSRKLAILLFVIGVAIFIPMLMIFFGILHKEAIHDAVRRGDVKEVQEILDREPEMLEQRNRLDLTPLNEAAWEGQVEVLRLLINRGANVNATWEFPKTGDGRWNPLHIAANWDRVEAAEVLIKAGTDINLKTLQGETPLDIAMRNNHHRLAKLLKANGGKSGK